LRRLQRLCVGRCGGPSNYGGDFIPCLVYEELDVLTDRSSEIGCPSPVKHLNKLECAGRCDRDPHNLELLSHGRGLSKEYAEIVTVYDSLIEQYQTPNKSEGPTVTS